MRKFSFFIITLFIAISFVFNSTFADDLSDSPILRLDLDSAVKMALDSSEDLKIKDREVGKSEGKYGEARSGMFPHINAESTFLYNIDYPNSMNLGDYDSISGLTASQLIWSFGRVMYAVNSAKKAVEASRFSREAGKLEIIYSAKLSYYSNLLARNALSITESSYANALENKKLLGERSYGGRSPRYEILRMDTDVASRVPTVNEARAQFGTSTETLKKIAGIDPLNRIELTDDFSEDYGELDYDMLVNAMYEYEPSLKSLAKYIESADSNVKSKYASFLPTVSGFTSWDYLGAPSSSMLNGNETGSYAFAGVKISVPIWEGGEKQAQLRQARMDKEIAMLQRKRSEKDLLLALKKASLEYRQYRDNLKANMEAVRLAEESYRQTRDMFAAGQVDLTDLNDSELLLTNQRLNKELTLFNINVTLARIEKLIAGHYDKKNTNRKT
ncbi:MAG: TolC family protein [Candidatus Omnitrophica bacterium]|nr:TolC family protein [Candidatus Omnitrophota bacterium]MDD5771683.1 TolC family protein [Candidatus Omnitrophota bacterium]